MQAHDDITAELEKTAAREAELEGELAAVRARIGSFQAFLRALGQCFPCEADMGAPAPAGAYRPRPGTRSACILALLERDPALWWTAREVTEALGLDAARPERARRLLEYLAGRGLLLKAGRSQYAAGTGRPGAGVGSSGRDGSRPAGASRQGSRGANRETSVSSKPVRQMSARCSDSQSIVH
jgi:hypothetical protein